MCRCGKRAAQGQRRAVPDRSGAVRGKGARDRGAAQVSGPAPVADAGAPERGTGRAFDVEQHQAEVDQLRAQLEGAKWNLDKTVVRAPADGYVTNLALRKGARVGSEAVMAFIDTSETIIGVEIPDRCAPCRPRAGGRGHLQVRTRQNLHRQGAAILQAISSGQTRPTGLAVNRGGTGRPVHRALSARRCRVRPSSACRQCRRRGDLHRSCQVDARHSARSAPPLAILNYINPF